MGGGGRRAGGRGGKRGGLGERGDKCGGAHVVIGPCSLSHPDLGRINPVGHAPSSLVETPLGFFPSCPSMPMRGGPLVTGILAGNG